MAKFDPSLIRDPTTDRQKIWNRWLRPRGDPLCKISCKSVHWGVLGKRVKYNGNFSALNIPFLRAIAECFARLSHGLGVCPSVRHTAVLCQNGASWYYEIFTVGCLKVSSLSWQNFMPLGEGVPRERGHQRGVPPLKSRYFAVIGSYSVKTVADSYRHAAYHNKHWWQAF